MDKKLIVITGASGSGKTTTLNLLKEKFETAEKAISFAHFDSLGVPGEEEMVKLHGSVEEWQRITTDKWIKKLSLIATADHRILFEGQMRIAFIKEALSKYNLPSTQMILLDCSDTVRRTRLNTHRLQPELANDQMMAWAKYLREEAEKEAIYTIDTSLLTPDEVASKILKKLL